MGDVGSSPIVSALACELLGVGTLYDPAMSVSFRDKEANGRCIEWSVMLLGVTGNTSDSDSDVLGSNPREAALRSYLWLSFAEITCLCRPSGEPLDLGSSECRFDSCHKYGSLIQWIRSRPTKAIMGVRVPQDPRVGSAYVKLPGVCHSVTVRGKTVLCSAHTYSLCASTFIPA